MWEAIIGVAGTILGTILGWLLAKVNVGAIKIHFSKIYNESYERNGKYFGASIPNKQEGEVYHYSAKFDILLYNNSEQMKTIRNTYLSFRNEENKELFKEIINDYATQRYIGRFWHIDKLGVINLEGKSGLDITASFNVSSYIDALYQTTKIYFCYEDGKFKAKELLLCDNYKPNKEKIIGGKKNGKDEDAE